jgi:hypothetical protein
MATMQLDYIVTTKIKACLIKLVNQHPTRDRVKHWLVMWFCCSNVVLSKWLNGYECCCNIWLHPILKVDDVYGIHHLMQGIICPTQQKNL